jgi:hypothetical protein
MNKNKKKLTLRTNTIRLLGSPDLAGAAGGLPVKSGFYSCQLLCASGNHNCYTWVCSGEGGGSDAC